MPDPWARTDATILFLLAFLAAVFAVEVWVWAWPAAALLAIWASAPLAAAARPRVPDVPPDVDLYAIASAIQCKRCGPQDWGHCTCARDCGSGRCTGWWACEMEQLFTAPDPAPRKDTPR